LTWGKKKLRGKRVIESTIDRELQRVVYAIEKSKPLVNLKKAILYTDPLVGMLKTPLNKLSNIQATSVAKITSSGITLKYIKGKANILADALSRMKPEEKTKG